DALELFERGLGGEVDLPHQPLVVEAGAGQVPVGRLDERHGVGELVDVVAHGQHAVDGGGRDTGVAAVLGVAGEAGDLVAHGAGDDVAEAGRRAAPVVALDLAGLHLVRARGQRGGGDLVAV